MTTVAATATASQPRTHRLPQTPEAVFLRERVSKGARPGDSVLRSLASAITANIRPVEPEDIQGLIVAAWQKSSGRGKEGQKTLCRRPDLRQRPRS